MLAAPLAAAALAAGCGATPAAREGADTEGGKQLFTEKCGQCHVLADAGTQGEIGPNLDDAFGFSREQDFDESTFFEVTLEQMEIPGPPMPDFDNPADKKNFLTEEQRVDVAAYVASVAGKPAQQAAADVKDPKQIFTSVGGCGSCHVLEDAGTTGTTGPNLDESKPGLQEAIDQITNGGGGMPAFQGKLTDDQIKAVADYIVKSAKG